VSGFSSMSQHAPQNLSPILSASIGCKPKIGCALVRPIAQKSAGGAKYSLHPNIEGSFLAMAN
jgi:hypothetical protein